MSILVSVVSPFFNEEEVIIEAIKKMYRSLETQFADSFELIMVNDGSTDDSMHLIEEGLSKNGSLKNLKIVGYKKNQGILQEIV